MPRSYPDREILLGVVIDYLDGELYQKLTGVDRYRGRVAINALRIVQREMAMGPSLEAADRRELLELRRPGDGEKEDERGSEGEGSREETLAHDIALGRCPLDDPELVAYLRRSLHRALQVNNPKWTVAAPTDSPP